MQRSFSFTSPDGLPFCVIRPRPDEQIWNVMLCGIQVAELFPLPRWSPNAVCVSPWSPDKEGYPVVVDVIVDGPDYDTNVTEALTHFSSVFLDAARQEQKLMEAANA